MAHEALGDGEAVAPADFPVAAAQTLEVAVDALVIVRPVASAGWPHQRVDRNDAAAAEVLGSLERDSRRLLPFEPVLRLEFDAGDHRGIHVAAAPETHGGFERLDPAVIADVAVLARTDLGEQRFGPHLEVEADELHQVLGVELLDEIVGDGAAAERHRDAARVGLLHEARELQEALAFQPTVRERAADQVDVTDLGLVDDGLERFAHALERRLRDLHLPGLLAEVRGALVGRAIRAERAAHRMAVLLVQEVFAAGRDVDDQHVTVRGDARLRVGQAVGGLLRHPGLQRLELDRHGAPIAVVDEPVALHAGRLRRATASRRCRGCGSPCRRAY